jgi:hypothetical protein
MRRRRPSGAGAEHGSILIAASARLVLPTLIAATVLLGAVDRARAQTPPPLQSVTVEATLVDNGSAATTIRLTLPDPWGDRTLEVGDATAPQRLVEAHAGDVVEVDLRLTNGAPDLITKLVEIRRPVGAWPRMVTVILAFLGLALITAVLTGWRPLDLIVGTDNRYSNSQTQLMLWFGAVATIYVASVVLRLVYFGWDFIGGVGLPQNLIVITGLSALSFGGAKVITAQKVDAAAGAGLPPPKPPAAARNLLRDLIQNDLGHADLGDLQMILVTAAAVVIFGLSAFHFLGALALQPQVQLPDVDTALLSGFGLGQGAYLVKKAALPLGQG